MFRQISTWTRIHCFLLCHRKWINHRKGLFHWQPVKSSFWIRHFKRALWVTQLRLFEPRFLSSKPALLHPHYTALSASFIHIMSPTIPQFSLQFALHFFSLCVLFVCIIYDSIISSLLAFCRVLCGIVYTRDYHDSETAITPSWTEMEKSISKQTDCLGKATVLKLRTTSMWPKAS